MDFDQIIAEIEKYKDTRKKKIMLVFDDCGCGDSACMSFLFYKSHTYEEITCINRQGGMEYICLDDADKVISVLGTRKASAEKFAKAQEYKSPKTNAKHVGVEIEFISKLDHFQIQSLIADNDLEKYVTLKEDSSLDGEIDYDYTHEICILGTERTINKLVTKVCNLIKRHSTVNSTCGLHVHLDMRNRDVSQSYANLFAAQGLLYSMCPLSRINGEYCKPETEYVSFENEHVTNDRWYGINKNSYEDHKTLEVRMHSGSLNADKINNWIKLLIKIVDRGKVDIEEPIIWSNLAEVKNQINLVGKLDKYVKERINKFKNDHLDRMNDDGILEFAA